MPRFNRVFEDLGIEYEDYVVPPEVLLGLEKKKDSSKAVVAAEAKKRKGGGGVKQLAKKRKAEVVLETPVESSSARSSAAESNSVAAAPAEVAPAGGVPEVEASRAVSSVRAPFASLLGEESSDAEPPEASPAREANPAVAEGSAREVSAGGGSPPKDVQESSSDEAESASVRRVKMAEAPPRLAGDGINSLYIGLATAEELAKGASIAQEGLAVPPHRVPAPSALASRPSPADVLGPGASDPSISGWTDALREVHSLVGDRFGQKLRGMDFDTLLRIQYEHHSLGHHMAAALEERCSREVICRDEAIGALKKENETLEAEKARLSEEVKEFSSVRREIESLRKERDDYKAGSEVLKKEKEDAEASAAVLRTNVTEAGRARDLALQRAKKAEDIADRLRKELDAERTSAAELQTRMQKAEAEAAAIVGLYADSLAQFGGSTSAPPPSGDVGAGLAWLKSHIRMLPDFVGGAVDFGALAAEIAKKKAKVDKAGPSRPPSEAHPLTQAEAEACDAGAKAPEGSAAKVPEQPETSAPPPPQPPYPILRIFGEKDRVRWVSEVPEDLAEPFLHGYPEVVRSAPEDVLPSNFVEGSYVTPVTFKRGDLYARGYLIDWWRHKYPTRSIDDLVDFLVRDYCDELRLIPDSYVKIVRGS
ncbi:uncharacterized protein LOC110434730 [Sorghum bicolor]|uniref:uncharacterized protein LOC110434730 n=1 Tax=Sorghum bicolor TaxID=4558 RepID=UPI000B4254B5|nr:uncharacterized protein LOC110434730 [Sorghum bicolor]|eukprot:XP_021315120.1 uncharacterized protein LOC110434730 [Sorghum bicolor]